MVKSNSQSSIMSKSKPIIISGNSSKIHKALEVWQSEKQIESKEDGKESKKKSQSVSTTKATKEMNEPIKKHHQHIKKMKTT